MASPIVVITGASSGIGRATALRFAARGASLVLASRSAVALNEAAFQCRELGATVETVPTDVTDENAVRDLADRAVRRFGRIDVWVNAAATSVFAPFTDVPMDDLRQVIDTDLLGYVYGARAALKVMVEQRSGVVINVGSIIGEVPQPYTAPYSIAKAGVRALGASIRSELWLQKLRRIAVVTILPPTMDTPFFAHAGNRTGRAVLAMPPVYPADTVARAVVRCAGRPRDEYVVGRIGRALVRRHRRNPRAIERALALETEVAQLSRTERAPSTAGILYEPGPPGEEAVSGGHAGRAREGARRMVIPLLAVAAAVWFLVRRGNERRAGR